MYYINILYYLLYQSELYLYNHVNVYFVIPTFNILILFKINDFNKFVVGT